MTFGPARRHATAVVATIGVLASACSGSSDTSSTTASSTTISSTTISSTTLTAATTEVAPDDRATNPPTVGTAVDESAPSVPSTTVDGGARPGVVALEGSVEDLLGDVPGADHFNELVTAWLAAVPGQEGVLRNARGITLFVPTDDAFSAADRDALLDDFDATARFIGEHLVVSILTLADLPETVVTAMGTEHAIEGSTNDGSTIDGYAFVVADITATNGVIHLIEGPLVAPG